MKTKNFFLFGLPAALLALSLVLVGCDEGDDDNTPGFDRALVGTWHSTQAAADDGESVAFEFTADGRLTITGQSDAMTIKATTSGGRITLKLTAGGQTTDGGSVRYVVSGTELTLSEPSNPGPVANILYNIATLSGGILYKSSSSTTDDGGKK
ncbi:MAG: hypothetical protein LBK25_00195 [Treponema sp.]|jgi:hypothetical protein|nr:hypothetical protein [Treponema sp.]